MNIRIMWNEIGITFLVIITIRISIDLYIRYGYYKIYALFYSHEWAGIEKRIRKHQKLSYYFSRGQYNTPNRVMYNQMCVILGSIGLINGNEEQFVMQLQKIRPEDKCDIKYFLLALYFQSEKNYAMAKECYGYYVSCVHEDTSMEIIMKHIFGENESNPNYEELSDAIKQFKNPAIIQLLEKNHILQN